MIPPPTSFPRRGGGFSLVELLVLLAVMAILASLLIPGISSARDTAKRTQCTSNLRQIGVAAVLYAGDHNGWFPPFPSTAGWSPAYTVWNNPSGVAQWVYFGALYDQGYLTDGRVFYCPTALKGMYDYASQWAPRVKDKTVTQGFRIGYVHRVIDTTAISPVVGTLAAAAAGSRVLMTDICVINYSGHPLVPVHPNGQRGVNVLYGDGHVKYDPTGNLWAHTPTASIYTTWDSHP